MRRICPPGGGRPAGDAPSQRPPVLSGRPQQPGQWRPGMPSRSPAPSVSPAGGRAPTGTPQVGRVTPMQGRPAGACPRPQPTQARRPGPAPGGRPQMAQSSSRQPMRPGLSVAGKQPPRIAIPAGRRPGQQSPQMQPGPQAGPSVPASGRQMGVPPRQSMGNFRGPPGKPGPQTGIPRGPPTAGGGIRGLSPSQRPQVSGADQRHTLTNVETIVIQPGTPTMIEVHSPPREDQQRSRVDELREQLRQIKRQPIAQPVPEFRPYTLEGFDAMYNSDNEDLSFLNDEQMDCGEFLQDYSNELPSYFTGGAQPRRPSPPPIQRPPQQQAPRAQPVPVASARQSTAPQQLPQSSQRRQSPSPQQPQAPCRPCQQSQAQQQRSQPSPMSFSPPTMDDNMMRNIQNFSSGFTEQNECDSYGGEMINDIQPPNFDMDDDEQPNLIDAPAPSYNYSANQQQQNINLLDDCPIEENSGAGVNRSGNLIDFMTDRTGELINFDDYQDPCQTVSNYQEQPSYFNELSNVEVPRPQYTVDDFMAQQLNQFGRTGSSSCR